MTNSAHTEDNSHLLVTDRERLMRVLQLKERVKVVMEAAQIGPDSIALMMFEFDQIYADFMLAQDLKYRAHGFHGYKKEIEDEKSPD